MKRTPLWGRNKKPAHGGADKENRTKRFLDIRQKNTRISGFGYYINAHTGQATKSPF